MFALALVILLASAGVYFTAREALLEQFDLTLRAKANAISSDTEKHGNRLEVELTEQFMREFNHGIPIDFFQVWDATGATVRRSQTLGQTNLAVRFGTFRRPTYWNLTLPSGLQGRAVGYSFSPGSESREDTAGGALVVFASERRELDESLRVLAVVLAGCVALFMLATAIIVPPVLRRELTPLKKLSEQVAHIHAGSLSYRFSVATVPGEIKPISERLNHLMSRLEESFERERRFSADLAHELRTPIAELRNLAEVALKWPESRPAETDEDVLDIAVQMEGVVTRLLDLLRGETHQMIYKPEPVSLARLMEQSWPPFLLKAQAKGLVVTENIPDDAKIHSDPILLRSVVANLLDNAVEYTPAGGSIRVDSGACGGCFTLRIVNSVETLTAGDLSKLFDRFWRKDQARSDARHSGLGLSLARALAEVLGMELKASMDGPAHLALTLQGTSTPLDKSAIS